MKTGSGKKGVIVIEGHVQGLANARALGRAGIPVIVISEFNCIARYSKYCTGYYKCPGYLMSEFIDFLVDLAIAEDIRDWVLLPSNDHAVFNISMNIEKLKPYFKIISPETEIFENIYNKELLIKLCRSVDVPVPVSWFPAAPEEIDSLDLIFPLLVKGKNGLTFYKNTGKKAFLVEEKESMKAESDIILEKSPFTNIFFQDLIPYDKNKPVSFTSFSIKGEIRAFWMGIKVREHPVDFGTATFSRSIDVPELIPLAEKVLRKLLFTGVSEIEFLFDSRDNTYKLIEINARTWLWVDMAIKCGINYPVLIYNYLNNIKIDYPEAHNQEFEWMHYITDIPYSLLGLFRGDYSFGTIFKSYRRFPKPAVFDSSDIMPSFAEILLLPLLILRR